jgi:hypothetical protein
MPVKGPAGGNGGDRLNLFTPIEGDTTSFVTSGSGGGGARYEDVDGWGSQVGSGGLGGAGGSNGSSSNFVLAFSDTAGQNVNFSGGGGAGGPGGAGGDSGIVPTGTAAFVKVASGVPSSFTTGTVFNADGDILYIGLPSKYALVKITFSVVATGLSSIEYAYSLGSNTWKTYASADGKIFEDDTISGGSIFGQDGYLCFIGPGISSDIVKDGASAAAARSPWAVDTVFPAVGSYYWIRLTRTTPSISTVPDISAITIPTDKGFSGNYAPTTLSGAGGGGGCCGKDGSLVFSVAGGDGASGFISITYS